MKTLILSALLMAQNASAFWDKPRTFTPTRWGGYTRTERTLMDPQKHSSPTPKFLVTEYDYPLEFIVLDHIEPKTIEFYAYEERHWIHGSVETKLAAVWNGDLIYIDLGSYLTDSIARNYPEWVEGTAQELNQQLEQAEEDDVLKLIFEKEQLRFVDGSHPPHVLRQKVIEGKNE